MNPCNVLAENTARMAACYHILLQVCCGTGFLSLCCFRLISQGPAICACSVCIPHVVLQNGRKYLCKYEEYFDGNFFLMLKVFKVVKNTLFFIFNGALKHFIHTQLYLCLNHLITYGFSSIPAIFMSSSRFCLQFWLIL